MKGQYFIIIAGQNASGKTTLAAEIAKEFAVNIISNDSVRDLLASKIPFFSDSQGCSYLNEKSRAMSAVAHAHNIELVKQLLLAGESVLLEGSGISKKRRAEKLKLTEFAIKKIKTVIIEIQIPEDELLRRLKLRDDENQGHRWVDFYNDVKKAEFESVSNDEADYVLKYDQNNREAIMAKLREILQ